jgi:hypothetical protein
MEPDQSKSIPLPPNRQRLIDDVIALYSCQPTVERVARYAPACVYDDQFVYANGEWRVPFYLAQAEGRQPDKIA